MDKPNHKDCLYMLDNVPVGLMVINSETEVMWCNNTLAKWLGGDPSECLGKREVDILFSGDSADAIIGNGPYQLPSGRWLMRKLKSLPDGLQSVYYIDVTEEESLRRDRNFMAQQLDNFNTIDTVSGLLNDNAINKGLEPLVSRSRRYQNPLSLVTMEIIGLEDLIKAKGQVAADKTILAISQLLRDQLRWADLVGRLDSGHFIFVLPETNQDAAILLANKISDQLNQLKIKIEQEQIYHPQACFGVTSWGKGDDARMLLNRSAEAAHVASQNGPFTIQAA